MIRLACGLVGLVLLAAAGMQAVSVSRFSRQAVRAEGVVIGLSGGGSHPRVRFRRADGGDILFSGGGLIFGYAAGDRVPVLYLAGAPQESARLAAFGSLWFLPILLGAIGLCWMLVPVSQVLF